MKFEDQLELIRIKSKLKFEGLFLTIHKGKIVMNDDYLRDLNTKYFKINC